MEYPKHTISKPVTGKEAKELLKAIEEQKTWSSPEAKKTGENVRKYLQQQKEKKPVTSLLSEEGTCEG